ncbi:MAG: CDP-alcohol phosphatidyltransferase family protein [Spirochaetota bacterium]
MRIKDLLEGRVATWSNLISVVRVLLAPAIAVALYYERLTGDIWYCKVAVALYLVVAVSDFIDGILARLLHQVSRLGQFLDPIADKCVIFIVAVTLYYFRQFPLWMIVLILIRDILHIIAGFYLFYVHDIQVRSSIAGKCMVVFMGLCGLIFIVNPLHTVAGYTLQQISLLLVVLFMVVSSISNWRIYSKIYFTGKR